MPRSREKLFNIIVGCFLAFYGGFALVYPHHDALHLTGMADKLVGVLPAGLSGAPPPELGWAPGTVGPGLQDVRAWKPLADGGLQTAGQAQLLA